MSMAGCSQRDSQVSGEGAANVSVEKVHQVRMLRKIAFSVQVCIVLVHFVKHAVVDRTNFSTFLGKVLG